MEFLSLSGPPERPPGRRITRAEAIGLSILAHVILLLLLVQGEHLVPASLRRWIEARPARVAANTGAVAMPPGVTQPPQPVPAAPESRRIPLKFAYVKVPNDVATAPNKDATLLSDRDRRARQEMPTPPDVRQFSRDPHSEGDSIDRVRPDPTRPEGQDAPMPSGPEAPAPPPDSVAGLGEGKGPSPEAGAEARPPGPEGSDADAGDAMIAHGDLVPPPAGAGTTAAQPVKPGTAGQKTAGGGRSAGAEPGGGSRRPADMRPKPEYKFQFNNPGWLKGGGYGTMSFDTQGFPWGDYARQLYVAIRNNWLERIPLAAREGIAGHTCQHFTIARDGMITALDVVRPSEVPPFTKAASDAIRASSPLPPLPPDFPKPEEGVTFCFFYNMYPGEAEN